MVGGLALFSTRSISTASAWLMVIQEDKELRDLVDETAKDLQRQKSGAALWRFLAIAVVCFWLYQKKSHTVWLPVADSQQMCVVISDWWGLKVQAYYPVWRTPTGETGPFSEQWCIKFPDNTWRVFYAGRGQPSDYKYPPVVYNTYF